MGKAGLKNVKHFVKMLSSPYYEGASLIAWNIDLKDKLIWVQKSVKFLHEVF